MKEKIKTILSTHQVNASGCLKFFLEYLEGQGFMHCGKSAKDYIENYSHCVYIKADEFDGGYAGNSDPKKGFKVITPDEFFALLEEPEFKVNDWVVAQYTSIGGGLLEGCLYQIREVEGNKDRVIVYKNSHGKVHPYDSFNFRLATNAEIEKHLRSLLPDWMEVGKKIAWKFDNVSRTGNIDTILFINGSTCMSLLENRYFKKYGPFLSIRAGGYIPFGATTDESIVKISKASQLPVINGYEGEIQGRIVKYGCAEISSALLGKLVEINEIVYCGNRRVKGFVLDSGVTINYTQAKEILDNWE